jgi:hypothetical protein
MAEESDWRLTIAKRLTGASFQWKMWYPPNERWDHDHCAACGAQFCNHETCNSFKEGYAISDEYHLGEDYEWVCKKCFDDLRDNLEWKVVPAD